MSSQVVGLCGLFVLLTGVGFPQHLYGETAEQKVSNTFEQKLGAVIVPEIHIRMPEERKKVEGLLAPVMGQGYASQTASSNQISFVICVRNMNMLELVDLIFFLSDTTYVIGNNGLIVAPTNMPAFRLKQEKELIAKLKKMSIPMVYIYHPDTMVDVIEFLYQASVDYDDPEIPIKQRGLSFAVKNQQHFLPFEKRKTINQPLIPCGGGGAFCSLYDVVTNCCAKAHAQFIVRNNTLVIYPAPETNSPALKPLK